MNDPRYHQLLARVLDDELTRTESDELIEWLREKPAAGSEIRKHLQLWELYSQQIRAERSSDAFAEACRIRLLAETDEQKFVHETEQRLRRADKPGAVSLAERLLLVRQWIVRLLPSPRWALATVAVAICVFVLPGFLRTQGEPELASVTGPEIQIVRDGQSLAVKIGLRLQPNDVIRTTGEGRAVISYGQEATRLELEPNSELKFLTWKSGKHFDFRAGKLEATVARQRSWRPMILVTAPAEVQVLGTEFSLVTTTNVTRLEVTEGKVQLTRRSDGKAVKVPAGHYAIAAANTELAALPLARGVLREYWTNLTGGDWVHLITYTNYPDRPDGWNYLTNLAGLEMPSNWADNYGVRIRGYLHPPETGAYTFWIAAKDDASLWLSRDGGPENKVQVANSEGHASRDWDRWTRQRSASFRLTAGKTYYFEVLHKAGVGDDHLAVAWQPPGRERAVIASEFLSPFKTTAKEKKR